MRHNAKDGLLRLHHGEPEEWHPVCGCHQQSGRGFYEHKNNLVEGFTKQYDVHTLVWFESTPSIEAAIAREKQLKNWKREWKLALLEKTNPDWCDLYDSLL